MAPLGPCIDALVASCRNERMSLGVKVDNRVGVSPV
jgi:hypothetical protein